MQAPKTDNPIAKQLAMYVVWVGDTEVVDYYVTLDVAKRIKEEYEDDSYDDVVITEGFMRTNII